MHFAANLPRKRFAKFRQHHPSFVGDITENIVVSFFSVQNAQLKKMLTDKNSWWHTAQENDHQLSSTLKEDDGSMN